MSTQATNNPVEAKLCHRPGNTSVLSECPEQFDQKFIILLSTTRALRWQAFWKSLNLLPTQDPKLYLSMPKRAYIPR